MSVPNLIAVSDEVTNDADDVAPGFAPALQRRDTASIAAVADDLPQTTWQTAGIKAAGL